MFALGNTPGSGRWHTELAALSGLQATCRANRRERTFFSGGHDGDALVAKQHGEFSGFRQIFQPIPL